MKDCLINSKYDSIDTFSFKYKFVVNPAKV